MTPQEFAAQVSARLTMPSEPHRARNIFAKTDVEKTWAQFQQPKQPLRRAK